MLTRFTATAGAFILGAALAVVLPPAAARADCKVINDIAYCDASDTDKRRGSGGSGGGNGGGNTGPGIGCPDDGTGVPGGVCDPTPPAAVQEIPSINLAFDARGSLGLPAPRIHWSPDPRTYVQLRTGLWVDQADFSPFTRSVTAGDQTVTVTATPKNVRWALVETTINCPNAGNPDGTACGYTYQRSSAGQPGGKYHITATITWGVEWQCDGDECDGDGGPLDDISMSSTAELPVDEIQTESQPG
ncbi:MAG TPA: hypothetical protein VE465_16110 [Streptosporangiaceae bacterium]|jgi:hypothetical protein|nr:hypothetical protein [Streptosporangiaceae bacterium]